MQQSIRILCNIYNFIGVSPRTSNSINMKSIEQFRQIYLLINQLVTSEYMHPRSIFQQLCLFINKEEQVFGPRKFRKMIESISTIIVEFVAGKLRSGNSDIVVLCLTYYTKYCQRHFTSTIRILIIILYALTHFQKNTVDIAQNYIVQARQLLKIIAKQPQGVEFTGNTKIILDLLEGMACFRKENFNRAKFIFSEIIGHMTQRMHNQQSKTKKLTFQTSSFFTTVTYFLSETYGKLNQYDRAAYYATQCLDFASSNIPNHQPLSQHLIATHHFSQTAVKLGRIENKIQRIKSLHSFHSRSRPNSATKENLKVQPAQFKISKKNKQIIKVKEGTLKQELDNLLIIQQRNEVRLKKKTLKQLHVQQLQKSRKIQSFQQQIIDFQQQKIQISNKYPNQRYYSQIAEKQQKLKCIKSQISNKKWQVVGTLKPTKKIGSYLHGFFSAFIYQKHNIFIKFLYNQVSFISHLKLYSFFRKIKSKLVREKIFRVKFGKVMHQVQLLRHKIKDSCHMKIYQIQKGPGLNIEHEISQQVLKRLIQQPFCFSFQIQDGKIIPFKQYLQSLSQSLMIRVKLFIMKLRKKAQVRQKKLLFHKKEVNITFGTYYNQLKYLVFVSSRKLSNDTCLHSVERIDKATYLNPDYNIKINQTLVTRSLEVCEFELSQIITSCILAQKQKHTDAIIKIQKKFRFKLAQKNIMKLKQSIQVNTIIVKRSIFSLIVHANVRTFFIQNLDGKFQKVKIQNATFFNMSFLHKIRNQLAACQDCSQQMAVINKFFRLRNFAYKFIKKSQEVKLDTKFSSKFKKSLCFAKVMKQFLYRGKLIDGRMMYMLTVRDFGAFPRPYLLRVFTIEHKSLYSVDCEQVIFNSEKIYLQSNLERINHFLDIQDHKRVSILDGPYKPSGKMKRQNSKSTIVSNFSFGSGEEFLRERKSRLGSRLLLALESNINNRNKKNSINFKMRHKSALKQKDILLIKKWIEDSKEDSSISESQQSSTG